LAAFRNERSICVLREFSPKYLDSATGMFLELFRGRPFDYDWLTAERARDYLAGLMSMPNSRRYMYFADGSFCGACFGREGDCSAYPVFEILEIFVAKDAQRRGVGTEMLRRVELDLKLSGISAIRLSTSKDIPAYDFYIRNGYQTMESVALMSKNLEE
jgi:aminoglycoside 6'-N-acetyltransferase I